MLISTDDKDNLEEPGEAGAPRSSRAAYTLSAGGATAGDRPDADGEPDPRVMRAMRAFPAFRDLSRKDFDDVARMMRLRTVRRSEVLFERGAVSDMLFLVASGRFFVCLGPDTDPVAEIGAGEPVGELAFLTQRTRTATVIAARDSEVLEVSRGAYHALFETAPLLQQGLLERLAERMQSIAGAARPLARSPARTIALVPVGPASHRAPVPKALVNGLAAALSVHGRTGIVDATDTETAPERREERLAEMERDCSFVLCPISTPKRDGEAGTYSLLRHCDAVILVGRLADASDAVRDPLERASEDLFFKRNRTLILWRDTAETGIAGSAVWQRRHDVELHHHVALDCRADFERVARFMSGKAVGAVFGGGAAFGCGHLGLVRAFRDAGFTFDMFGGTSVGGAMAMALATGRPPEEAMDTVEEMFVRRGAMRRFTLPIFSLLDHTVFDRELIRAYEDFDIADLPLNAYAVSTNLSRNGQHVHRSGPVWKAVRSSSAIPGVLPPYATDDGELLVDGALVDNLPVSVMRDLKMGPNVLAGFFEEDGGHGPVRYETVPGRQRLFADFVLRRKAAFPGLLNVLARAMLVTSRRALRETTIGNDLLLRLPTPERMGLLDWKSGRDQEELCYRYVADLIEHAGGAEALLARSGPAGQGHRFRSASTER